MAGRFIYLFLSCLFLLTCGPFTIVLPELYKGWILIAFVLAVASYISMIAHWKPEGLRDPLTVLCILFIALILVGYCFHAICLRRTPGDQIINITDLAAETWRPENLKFTALCLFFPLLLLVHRHALRSMPLKTAMTFIAIPSGISIALQICQKALDPSFMNADYWVQRGRVGGLFSDPNACALGSFLLLSWSFLGIALGRRFLTKAAFAASSVILFYAIVSTGSRTVFAGATAFVLVFPMLLLFQDKDKRSRLLNAGLAAIYCLAVVIGVGLMAASTSKGSGNSSLNRLAETWTKYQDGGVRAIFFDDETRGRHFVGAIGLIRRAPAGGWGAGGFYREFPNEYYRRTGKRIITHDSALNHYLMIGGDFGLLALAVGVAILLLPIGAAVAASAGGCPPEKRFCLLAQVTGHLIFLLMICLVPPLYFPDVVWLWTFCLAFLEILAERTPRYRSFSVRPAYALTALAAGAICAAWGAYDTSYGEQGYGARQQSYWWRLWFSNCYATETWKEGTVRWCSGNALFSTPIEDHGAVEVILRFAASNPDIADNPLAVVFEDRFGEKTERLIEGPEWQTIAFPLDRRFTYSFPEREEFQKEYFVVSVNASRTWRACDWWDVADSRDLGVVVMIPDL